MNKPSKILKIVAFLQKQGYVIVERKPKNKYGRLIDQNVFVIQPIAY